jgi:flap endonuclease-1
MINFKMGIKNLNRFLRDNCPESINCISLAELSGKKIAIDTSIYMYKFAGDDTLIENMYLMLATFRYYNIIPVFIFDGKPPTEKKELLQKRRCEKQEAENEYKNLAIKLKMSDCDEERREEIIETMDSLKKKFVHITREQIDNVKQLITAYGVCYYDAKGEADELCAMLVIKKKVWGCLSEDMDLFVYGCKRVLRYLSLMNHSVVLYDFKGALNELRLTMKEFREICVLSGTDYNINSDDNNLHNTLKMFKKFRKNRQSESANFYEWLIENTDYIEDEDTLLSTCNMFDLSVANNSKVNAKFVEKIKINTSAIQKNELKLILKEDGFMFP